ncbi:MAG: hypothetical protein IJW23_05280 [Lentisphaeria bacterium]|nr:hypothetical protein [Lentisphaeria bacterium]
MRFFLSFSVLIALILFCGCAATGPYVEKASDRLTDKEKFHLFDYSRHFIINTVITKPQQKEAAEKRLNKRKKREIKQNDLSPQEREALKKLIMSKDPTVRIRYTGYKQGRLSLSWVLPGKLQVIVSAEGRLDLSGSKQAQWRLNVIRYKRDCYMLPEQLGIPAVD